MTNTQNKHHKSENKQHEALKDLKRLEGSSEVLGTSTLARAAGKAREHLEAKDVKAEDRMEVWGTRIGRILAVAAVIYLVYRLVTKYLI